MSKEIISVMMSSTHYTGELEEVNFFELEEMEVHWKLKNFNSLPRHKSYRSPDFEFLKKSCCLRIEPSKDSNTYRITVYIQMDKVDKWSCRSWDIKYTLGIKKADGSLSFIKSENYEISYESNPIEVENFFTRNALQEQESELLPSNNLTILCKLQRVHGACRLKGQNALLSNIKGLLTNKDHCDVILRLPDKEFQAHKLILAAQSSVFSAMFKHDTFEKKSGLVKIFGCDPDSFEDFLKYLYSGDSKIISGDNALHLYVLSDRYDIQDLKTYCLEFMNKKFISKDYCLDAVVMGEETGDKELFAAAQKSFSVNIKEILASDEWMAFLKKSPILANKLLFSFTLNPNIYVYEVQNLKKFSLEYKPENLNKDHFFDAVIIAAETGDLELYAAAQKFFNGNKKEILASDVWMTYLKEHTILANKLLLRFASETHIFSLGC